MVNRSGNFIVSETSSVGYSLKINWINLFIWYVRLFILSFLIKVMLCKLNKIVEKKVIKLTNGC